MVTAIGLGYGTIAIIAEFIFALLIPFCFGRSTHLPVLICVVSRLIPIILIIIFTASPKKSQILTDSDQVDPYMLVDYNQCIEMRMGDNFLGLRATGILVNQKQKEKTKENQSKSLINNSVFMHKYFSSFWFLPNLLASQVSLALI